MKIGYIFLMTTLVLIGFGIEELNPFPPIPDNAPDSAYVWANPYIKVRVVSILAVVSAFPVGLLGIFKNVDGSN